MCRKGLTPVIQEKFNILEEIKQWKMYVNNEDLIMNSCSL